MTQNQIAYLFSAFAIIVFSGCKNEQSTKGEITETTRTEIVTRTYSIKSSESNVVEKDTVNMIQSIVMAKNGKEEANIFYNLDESISWKDVYVYDPDGNKVGSKFYEGGKDQTIYYKYDVDDLGRKIGFSAFDINTDTLLYDGVSRFENEGAIRKDGYLNKKGEFKWNLKYEFDKDGKETGYVYVDLGSGEIYPTTYKYTKFDEDGEWIERQAIEKSQVQSIETREFRKLD